VGDTAKELAHLRELILLRFTYLDREQALRDELVRVALQSMNYRFDNTNEWRKMTDAMLDNAITKSEYIRAHESLVSKVDIAADSNDKRFRGIERLIYTAVGGVAIIMVILNFFKK
jgi:hypothetical protein